MIHTDSLHRRRATDRSTVRAWAVRSVYGLFVLAMLFYFQNRTTEQERIHRAMTGGLPQAVIAVEKVNQLCFQEIEEMVESYPIDRHRDYLGIASSVWKHGTAYSALLSGIAELPGKKERSDAFRNTMPDLIAMREILLFGCDADYQCSQGLQSIVPDANDLFWRAISQWDAVRRTDMLRLQTALASSIALRYYDGYIRGSDCGSVGGRQPRLVGQQIFPAVGDWYEAVAFFKRILYLFHKSPVQNQRQTLS
ncbi:MAG: hypothetical protein IPM98_03095 [Lewinellaceae bacterium]|nr:hypothetical protein [Lewinellaceae bacterium]